MRIALLAQDGFSKLLAAGLTFGFALQTFIIVGGVLRVVPLTGHHAAVRLVRWLVDPLELRHARAADARVESRGRDGGRRMNRQLLRVTWVAMAMLVMLIVATTYWQTWARPGLAARQDNEIQRVAEFEIRRGLILGPDPGPRAQPRRAARAPHVLLPPLPAGKLRRPRRRLLDDRAQPRGPREVAQRRPHRHRPGALRPRQPAARRAQGRADRRATAWSPRSISRASESRSSSSAAAVGRWRHSIPAPARSSCSRRLRATTRTSSRSATARSRRSRPTARPAGAAAQPRHGGPLRPGLDVQGRDDVGGARVEPLRARLDVRRSRVLHGVRQAGQQLRHDQPLRPHHLATALQYSVNSVFCEIGKALGAKAILDQAAEVRLLRAPSARDARRRAAARAACIATGSSGDPSENREVDAGRMAFGQERMLVTPLQMAMVAGGIGNAGIVMRPYVVEKLVSPRGTTVARDREAAPTRAPWGR